MLTHHPSPADLVLAALAEGGEPADEIVTGHLRDCAVCRRELAELRDVVGALRAHQPDESAAGCLDEIDIARLLDSPLDQAAIQHLTSCAACRAQLTGAARVLHEPLVAAELERLAAPAQRPSRRRTRVAVLGGLAAAAFAGVLLWPEAERLTGPESVQSVDAYRERTLTTTAAPRILGPVGDATNADSLRWSSVPGADLYRITFWRRDGDVAWMGETRDTVLALPAEVAQAGQDLLWDVKARTGWDRWVVSDLAEFTLSSPGGMSR
jgi:hypothetical protein